MHSDSDYRTEVRGNVMNWKDGVTIKREKTVWLVLSKLKKEVAKEDLPIIELLEKGVTEDNELQSKVAAAYSENEAEAGLRLAQFVEDYADFLAEGSKSAIFD